MNPATVKFICAKCSHTATLEDIEQFRRGADQRVMEGSGIQIEVSPIKVTDVLRCGACTGGVMFASSEADESSEQFKQSVKEHFLELIKKQDPSLKHIDAIRLWQNIEHSSAFFFTPQQKPKRRGYLLADELERAVQERTADEFPSEQEMTKLLKDKMKKKFLELFRQDPRNKRRDPEKIWEALEKALTIETKRIYPTT